MSVQLLSPSEVRICGRKFLYKASDLFWIHDRESDPDYEEDEDWTFEHWCGPKVSDLTMLQHWNEYLSHDIDVKKDTVPSPMLPTLPTPDPITRSCSIATLPLEEDDIETQDSQQYPQDPKESIDDTRRTEMCVGDWVITFTSSASAKTANWICTHQDTHGVLWIADYDAEDIHDLMYKGYYAGTLTQYLDRIHEGIVNKALPPIFEKKEEGTIQLEITLIHSKKYTVVNWFTLKASQVALAVFELLKAHQPAKPVVVPQEIPAEPKQEELPPPPTPIPIVPIQPKRKGFVFGKKA